MQKKKWGLRKKRSQDFVKAHKRRLQHSTAWRKTNREILLGNKIPPFYLNSIIDFWRFFFEFIACRTLGTLRLEIPVGNDNGTTFKDEPKRGNGEGTRWGRYISWRVSSVV